MKKLLYSLAAIAALVLAASCEREVAITGDNGDLVEATFRVAVPSTVATKAISDGTQATCLRFLAYDKDGNFLPNLKPVGSEDGFVTVSGYTAEVRAKLIKGVTYNFVFFAESAKDKYTIDGANKTIAIPDITAMMNDDSFDAFYARVENYLVKGAFSEDIQLTRPFAQVNFGALDGDLEAAEASNILTAADKMQTGYELIAPTTLGILSGEVSGAEATELTLAYRPAEQLKVGDTFYDYVAMAYILRPVPVYYDGANEMAFTGTDVKENIASPVVLNVATTQNDAALALEREVYNVPVQRNYRTNILGNIFSVEGVFNILVDNNWATGVTGADETYIPEYETIDALNTAFASDASDAAKWSYKVKVLAAGDVKEIVLPNTADPVDLVFADGAWETEDISVVYAAADAAKPTKLTLKVDHLAGLTANLPQTTITVVEGSLIDEATITSAPHTFIIEKEAEVTNLIILGGGLKVEGTVGDAEVKPENAPITDVVIADGAAVEGTLAVSGGEVTVEENAVVEKLVVEGTATAEVNTAATVGEIVADNPAAVTDENNDPVDDVVAAIKSGAALKAAFEAGGTVTVEGDITDGAGLFLAATDPKEVVLDLNGHTVEFVGPAVGSTGTQTQALHLEKGSTVTIKNGTLKLGASANGIKMFIQNYSELTLKDVIVDFTGSGYSYALSNNFGHITITGATEITVDSGKTAFDLWYGMASSYADGAYVTFDENFTGTVNGNIEYGAASWGRNQEGWQDKAVLTIKGEGTFNGSFAEGNTGGLVGANINIYSGKFSSDPSAFAAPGLTGQQGTDGWWTLVEKTTVAHADFAVPEAVTIYTSGLHQNVTLEPVVASDYAGELAYAITEGSDVITLSGAQIGHKDQTTGTAKVKVTAPADNKYDAAEATVTVTVKANLIESLTWATEPTAEQKTFTVGDDFVRGGTVTENFTDGDSAEAGFYGIEYSGYDMTTAGEQTVTVTSVADNKATGCNTLSYTITVKPAPLTIAELKALLTTSSQTFEHTLNPVIVSGVSGSSAFIEDATGGIVVYKNNHGLTAGKNISGFVAKAGVLYSNGVLPEITNFDVSNAEVADADLPLIEKTIAEVNAGFAVMVGQRVKITDVTFPAVTGKTGAQTITVSQGDNTINVYAKLTESISAGSIGNIIGNITNYQSKNQITVTEDNAIEITTVALPKAVINNMPSSITTLKAGDEYTFAATASNGATVAYEITDGSTYATLDDNHKLTIGSTVAAGSEIKVKASAAAVANVCEAADDVVCTIIVAETTGGGSNTEQKDYVYVFNSKSWGTTSDTDTVKYWTSGTDGGQYTTNQGIQVSTSSSGANATSSSSFTNVSKIVVNYCTNTKKGVGTIKVQVGNGSEKSYSVSAPSADGNITRDADPFEFSTKETGKVKITVDCTTNSIYINSITITAD